MGCAPRKHNISQHITGCAGRAASRAAQAPGLAALLLLGGRSWQHTSEFPLAHAHLACPPGRLLCLPRSSAVPTLLALLNHENGDVAADAVEVLSELTSGDVVEDAVSGVGCGGEGGEGRGSACACTAGGLPMPASPTHLPTLAANQLCAQHRLPPLLRRRRCCRRRRPRRWWSACLRQTPSACWCTA